jgi:8-oxo-dGTP diphosphatase
MPKSEQGISTNRYSTIPRTLIFILQGHSVLLIKGAPDKKIWANRYNGIGGHIEKGEDVLEAGRRELREETGLDIKNLRLCGIVMVDASEDRGITLFVLSGVYNQKDEIIPSVEGLLEWIPVNEIGLRQVVEDLPVLIPKVISMGQSDPPFFASYHYDDADKLVIHFTD